MKIKLAEERQEQLMNLILSPCMTEKAISMIESNRQHTFKVAKWATKKDVKQAIEMMFDVDVVNIQINNVKGKIKRFAQKIGARADWKKAYVKLKEGQDISFIAKE